MSIDFQFKRRWPRPPLTCELIVHWLELYKEHDDEVTRGRGSYPTIRNRIVWDRNQNGTWYQVAFENWFAIDRALTLGYRSLPGTSSLTKLKLENGIDVLTHEKVLYWIRRYKEHDDEVKKGWGRYPQTKDKCVWDRDFDDRWYQVPFENWHAIDKALKLGHRGLPQGSSLTNLKLEHDLEYLKREQIVCYIKLYKEHDDAVTDGHGKYPNDRSEAVWNKDDKGAWYRVKHLNWHAIDRALTVGSIALPGGSSLAKLKREEGLGLVRYRGPRQRIDREPS